MRPTPSRNALRKDLSDQTVVVTTEAHGLDLYEIEKRVTNRLESHLAQVRGIHGLNGASTKGRSKIYIDVHEGADLATIRSAIEQTVSSIDDLPVKCTTPHVATEARPARGHVMPD